MDLTEAVDGLLQARLEVVLDAVALDAALKTKAELDGDHYVVNGAKAAGVQPIDTVFSDVTDMEGLAASCREAKSLGFVGKGCIHPRQIAVHEPPP